MDSNASKESKACQLTSASAKPGVDGGNVRGRHERAPSTVSAEVKSLTSPATGTVGSDFPKDPSEGASAAACEEPEHGAASEPSTGAVATYDCGTTSSSATIALSDLPEVSKDFSSLTDIERADIDAIFGEGACVEVMNLLAEGAQNLSAQTLYEGRRHSLVPLAVAPSVQDAGRPVAFAAGMSDKRMRGKADEAPKSDAPKKANPREKKSRAQKKPNESDSSMAKQVELLNRRVALLQSVVSKISRSQSAALNKDTAKAASAGEMFEHLSTKKALPTTPYGTVMSVPMKDRVALGASNTYAVVLASKSPNQPTYVIGSDGTDHFLLSKIESRVDLVQATGQFELLASAHEVSNTGAGNDHTTVPTIETKLVRGSLVLSDIPKSPATDTLPENQWLNDLFNTSKEVPPGASLQVLVPRLGLNGDKRPIVVTSGSAEDGPGSLVYRMGNGDLLVARNTELAAWTDIWKCDVPVGYNGQVSVSVTLPVEMVDTDASVHVEVGGVDATGPTVKNIDLLGNGGLIREKTGGGASTKTSLSGIISFNAADFGLFMMSEVKIKIGDTDTTISADGACFAEVRLPDWCPHEEAHQAIMTISGFPANATISVSSDHLVSFEQERNAEFLTLTPSEYMPASAHADAQMEMLARGVRQYNFEHAGRQMVGTASFYKDLSKIAKRAIRGGVEGGFKGAALGAIGL